MIEILAAVIVSSLIGSAHCVGMCGPFAILSLHDQSTAGDKSEQRRGLGRYVQLSSYHIGRLSTYVVLGLIVGSVGLAANRTSGWLGYSNVAARVIGALMIALGLWRIIAIAFERNRAIGHSSFMMTWTRGVIGIRKRLKSRSPTFAAYAWGATSTLLPCGWLYVYLLAAASFGSPVRSAVVMFAFWLGTLPLLSIFALGLNALGTRAQLLVQPLIACMLILFGIYTATGRASVDLSSIRNPVATTHQSIDVVGLNSMVDEPLPCCVSKDAKVR